MGMPLKRGCPDVSLRCMLRCGLTPRSASCPPRRAYPASIYPYNYPEELGLIPDFDRTSNS
eukprot:scaffold35916_cov68-Phaeocystis_antarctica.AAC.4